MKYAFFLGCATPVMARQNELSTRRVAKELDVELVDVGDFVCCGFPLRPVDMETSLLMAARNLSVAEKLGLDICTICSGCASELTEANKELKENSDLRIEVNEKLRRIGREYNGSVRVKHFAKVLFEDVGLEKIRSKVRKSLELLTIASHYGCHYLKPSHAYGKTEDLEFPRSLDELVAVTGAKSVDYEGKMQCCGGNLLSVDENITFNIASKKLDDIKAVDVDAVNLICPLCNTIYDRNQRIIESRLNKNYGLPVFFYSQILGLALGINPKELGLDMNRVRVTELLSRI